MLEFLSKYNKTIAWFFVSIFYLNLLIVPFASRANRVSFSASPQVAYNWNANPLSQNNRQGYAVKKPLFDNDLPFEITGIQKAQQPSAIKKTEIGPGQPEMEAFRSVNNSNMVDLFSGDFSYNIPLMDVGGYPVNLSYRSGISMDQEASWVGLGWNVNPGTISRNMRGLPDDFDGRYDSIKKTLSMKENKTVGVTAGAGVELGGLPIGLTVTKGIFHNSYKGWGVENGVNASINSGRGAKGFLSGGLSITDNSQEGVSIVPSVSVYTQEQQSKDESGNVGSFSLSLPYNSRSGLKGLQLSAGIRKYKNDIANNVVTDEHSYGSYFNSGISFFSPAFTPSITIPFTSRQFSFTAKTGALEKIFYSNFSISGYVSSQGIASADTLLALPAYGYLNYQEAGGNRNALLDFNLEKDLPYREKPPVPHIAIPSYTYDAFSITGEGTGGMFRAYRGDIGFVHDHTMRTKDESGRASIDLGIGDISHAGVDLNVNRAYSQNGPWLENNVLKNIIDFRRDTAAFEASYFRNPGEKAINSKKFYEALGGDDLVAVKLYQPSKSSSFIQATNYLTRYRNKRDYESKLLKPDSTYKRTRDKRTQVISYMTAKEADIAGLSKYIDNYKINDFTIDSCITDPGVETGGTGLKREYFKGEELKGDAFVSPPGNIDFPVGDIVYNSNVGKDHYSARWTGRLKAPETGAYTLTVIHDDGIRVWLNDSLFTKEDWHEVRAPETRNIQVNLIKDEFYRIKVEFYDLKSTSQLQMFWSYPGHSSSIIPVEYLFGDPKDSLVVNSTLTKEKRVNSFRKPNHLSEIDVLNNDGRRYVYGIPVYNLKQHDATFAVDHNLGDSATGLAGYDNITNSTLNKKGTDNYYKSEDIPAYAHSFLLTGILSSDYVDVSGNGISDDDLGDAVKFNYSKVAGVRDPFKWRAPYAERKVNYDAGLLTDDRDDKGNYVYGEKELWYLHSIESKTMVATFVVESRKDLLTIDEAGKKNIGAAKRLKEINLYSKADFARKGTGARPIKTVHFEYSYELCRGLNNEVAGLTDSGKLTLKKVWFTYNNNKKGVKNPYVFFYKNNQAYQNKAYDRWGNFKNATNNPTTGAVIPNDEYPYAVQDSAIAATNAAAWSLDSIYLPSGGSIKVDFESDDYAFVQDKRAMRMFKPAGFGNAPSMVSNLKSVLYDGSQENNYIYFSLPQSVTDKQDFYNRYLQGIRKLYFRLFVTMPKDAHGSGKEYVSGYADVDQENGYGISNGNLAWVKLAGISLKGDGPGNYSPMAKTAIQFLRLNLPSKAYKDSEPGDNLSPGVAVRMLLSSFGNIVSAFSSFDAIARNNSWARLVDLNRSYVRLNSPEFKKYGGGHRVKRVKIYDNWNKMTQRRGAVYGQEYTYTTQKEIGGVMTTISSGVASYEPGIGGEENPFRQPIEYVDKSSILGPVTLGYSEEPLGESFFPSASVGYSKVRVRTLNHTKNRSANGYEETIFYTSYDFPTYTDRSLIDDATKKRFKPSLANFLRINARHHMVLSQGFKIELNDMNGKLRSQASFAENDPANPLVYTENIYKTEDPSAAQKRLSNQVMVIDPSGQIDSMGMIGKDIELMVAMRENLSVTTGNNVNVNVDLFTIPFIPPIFIFPSLFGLYQREENLYRSVATMKVIQRYGILDKVIHVDKGSTITTKDLLYDSETGDVLLSSTQNEFNDPVYNFTYPSHWAYDAMGLAYKNINLTLRHISMVNGKITAGLSNPENFFSSGDEILVAGKIQTSEPVGCVADMSTFPSYSKIWSIDKSVVSGGTHQIYFIDKSGIPYNGNDITLKVIRSGRRNVLSAVGAFTSLVNPVKYSGGQLVLRPDSSSSVINASVSEFKQYWKVDDRKVKDIGTVCVPVESPDCTSGGLSCNCTCLKTLFDYLKSSKRLFIQEGSQVTVGQLVANAVTAGFSLNINDCPLLQNNAGKIFYALTSDSIGTLYRAQIGDCIVKWTAPAAVNFYALKSKPCTGSSTVYYSDSAYTSTTDTVTKTFNVSKTLNWYNITSDPQHLFPYTIPAHVTDTNTYRIFSARRYLGDTLSFRIKTFIRFDDINRATIPALAQIQSADLYLYADLNGFRPPIFPYPHMVVDPIKFLPYAIRTPETQWNYSSSYADLSDDGGSPSLTYQTDVSTQNKVVGVKDFVNDWLNGANGNRGMQFMTNTGDTLLYNTFGSHQYPISGLRPKIIVKYTIPDSTLAQLSVESCRSCNMVSAESCMSVISDTALNPYTAGILGNWRSDKNYTYYASRVQSDPTSITNIRKDGAIASFRPFWIFSGGKIIQQYDINRWVWNSERTLFNRKGFEIENKDPLGRYNSGLYGYSVTMPVAVIQNSRYRESGFDGFEDYNFTTQLCDTVCSGSRQFDFSSYRFLLDTLQKHSGKSSLRLTGDVHDAALSFTLSDISQDTVTAAMNFSLSTACGNSVLDKIKMDNKIILPSFSPLKGQRMVLSAWVKEDQDCNGAGYLNNAISIAFDAGDSPTFHASGSIIEGWQRYESVFDIPENATQITVVLSATAGIPVNFDDVRIHPYNANMKSFVFHPINLRLMAELDENNYATFYEYDDEGTLTRVKKETQRGIKTIKETRSALIKE